MMREHPVVLFRLRVEKASYMCDNNAQKVSPINLVVSSPLKGN